MCWCAVKKLLTSPHLYRLRPSSAAAAVRVCYPVRPVTDMSEYLTVVKLGVTDYVVKTGCWKSTLRCLPVRSRRPNYRPKEKQFFLLNCYTVLQLHSLLSAKITFSPAFTIIDHSRSGVVYNFGGVRMFVCLFVSNTITFASPWRRKFIFAHPPSEYGPSLYMKVIGSSSRSQEQKWSKILIAAM